jgi:5-methylcytosine-specific restriction endonuclease McrA
VKNYSLTHLSDECLRRELSAAVAKESQTTAELLAHIAEFDERKLYLRAAYPSMIDYCTGELRLSLDAAAKRLQVARVGRGCPSVFHALAEGRVHLSGLVLLAPHLTPETADELLGVALHKSKAEIQKLLAERAPKMDMPASVTPVAGPAMTDSHAPGHVEMTAPPVVEGSPGNPHAHAKVAPLSAEAFAVQFTRSREADERFRYAQDLLGHQVRSGDIAEVYDRAVRELIKRLEKARFGACEKPRKNGCRTRSGSRHIPNDVQREVWERDGGQCTFVSESGRRCEGRRNLQFDHVKEFARGGEATVANIRLRCPGHNQHTAEQTYGAGFIKQKREEAAAARAAAKLARDRAKAEKAAEREKSRLQPHQLEVIPWLLQLGCRKDQCRIAVERCRDMAEAPLEDRVKRALSWFGARIGRKLLPAAPAASNASLPAGAPA